MPRGILLNQAGKAKFPVVVAAALLWTASTLIFFVLHSIQQNLEYQVAQNKLLRDRMDKERQSVEDRLFKVQSLTGFFDKSLEEINHTDQIQVNMRELIDNKLRTINSEENIRGSRMYYGLMTMGEPSPEIEEDKLLVRDSPANIEKALQMFEKRIIELQNHLALVENAKNALVIEKESKISEREQVVQKLTAILNELEQKDKVMREKFEKQIQEVEKLTNEAAEAKAKAEKESKDEDKSIHNQELEFKNDISKKKSDIRKLHAAKYGRTTFSEIVKQRDFKANEEQEDGHLVFTDPRSSTVYVNLGEKQKVMRGLKFDVYRPAPKGLRVFKGRIELQKIMEKVSMARITEQDSLDPVVNGDLIINPIFQETQPVYFVFAGQFSSMSNPQVKKWIEKIGGVVEEEVSARTNFLVLGDKGEEHQNYRDAIRFGISLMTEKILLRYIGD